MSDKRVVTSQGELTDMLLAREREIEELKQKSEDTNLKMNAEITRLCHKLTLANEENESLYNRQKVLQEHKSDAEAQVKVLTRLIAQHDTIDELKLQVQVAELKIKEMTDRNQELHTFCDDRRNEHETEMASLESRHQKDLLVANGKLEDCKAFLEAKQWELHCAKADLVDATCEMELHKNEISRLTQILKERLTQCEDILERSSSEQAILMTQLRKAVELKRFFEDQCETLQKDVKELREQLIIKYGSAPQQAVLMATSHSPSINFCSPRALTRPDEASMPLTSALEWGLCSSRLQRSELDKSAVVIQELREVLQDTQNKLGSLEKKCANQQGYMKALQEVGDCNVKLKNVQSEQSQSPQVVSVHDLDSEASLPSTLDEQSLHEPYHINDERVESENTITDSLKPDEESESLTSEVDRMKERIQQYERMLQELRSQATSLVNSNMGPQIMIDERLQ